ncbi:MAG: hypothetical protein IJN34_06730 [Clostridia bacterium]|nr:hypothetical protein [Clostridia bacterium]
MKNKKWTWIVAAIVAVVLIAGFSVVGVVEWDQAAHEKQLEENDLFFERKDAPETRMFAPKTAKQGETKEKILTYKKTTKSTKDNVLDIYVDEEQVEYTYNKNGKLVGMIDRKAMDSETETKGKTITEEQAKTIAYQKGIELYGAEFKAFSLEIFRKQQDTRNYYITYAIRYGENGYVLGPDITFTVTETGAFYGSSNGNTDEYAAFDEQLLKSFTKADVDAEVDRLIKKHNGDSMESYEIDGYRLKYESGKYYLDVSVYLEFMVDEELGITTVDMETIRYEFPQ